MKNAVSKVRGVRIAPRKLRLIADLIRGKNAAEAENVLRFTIKRGAIPFLYALQSALASAKTNLGASPQNLYLAKVTVDEGPKLKRWDFRSRGRAYIIQKKTSHITLVLEQKGEGKETPEHREKEKEKESREEQGSPFGSTQDRQAKRAKTKIGHVEEEARPRREWRPQRIFRRKAV